MKLKKILSLPAKIEITALHYAHNVGMFFLLLPLLNSETSGSQKGPILSLYDRGFKALGRGFAKFQVGQMKALKKVGLLNDDEFIARMLDNYLHETHKRDADVAQRVDDIISMNNSGFLSDANAARFIGEEGHSSDLHFSYNPKKKNFSVFGDATDDEVDAMQRVWDKMQDWALEKADTVKFLTGAERENLAVALTHILQQVPISASENEQLSLSPRMSERGRLMVIFKEAVDGKGDPLVASEIRALSLPAMVDALKNDADVAYIRTLRPDDDIILDNEGFIRYLGDYAAKKDKQAPKP